MEIEKNMLIFKAHFGDNLADKALKAALIGKENVSTKSFIERGQMSGNIALQMLISQCVLSADLSLLSTGIPYQLR